MRNIYSVLEETMRKKGEKHEKNIVKIVDGGLYFIFPFHFYFTFLSFSFIIFYF